MQVLVQELFEIGIVPVIKVDDADKAVPLAKALVKGGIPCAEITFRTTEGEEAIRRISREVPDILVGAGTILTCEQVDRALDAGARFIVSPGYNPKVVDYCISKGITVTPGCSGPSDMERALSAGLKLVKFFPAEQSGGLEFIKAVSAPYPMLRFMPTGGISASNIASYLAFDKIVACGGSWMVKADLINDGRFDEISQLCREAVRSLLGFEFSYICLNGENQAAAAQVARQFSTLFMLSEKESSESMFVSNRIEISKQPGPGKHGQIVISTVNVQRAKAHLKRKDVILSENAQGECLLGEEIAGFAVKLVKQ